MKVAVAHFALLIALSAAIYGQSSTSSISGIVSDSSGAIIPNARVTATHELTGVTYRQTTTDTGAFAFPSVPVGSYTVAVEMRGFKTAQTTGNLLQVGSPIIVNITLEIGDSAETVSVVSTYEQLQLSNASIGNVVERKAIQELPLNGRNPLNLLVLEPGVVQRPQNAAGTGIHVNGSRDFAFNTTIDGIEANESTVPNPLNNIYRLNCQ